MTKRKLSLIIVSAILAAILLVVAICAIVAHSKDDKTQPTADLAVWQSMIKDDALLKDMVIAGAHDAGTKGLPYFAATQDRGIADLLNCGIRYLDLRVSYAKGKLLIYHGPSKGVALTGVLDDVRAFLTDHPTESVILDFQHFDEKNLEAQSGVIETLKGKMSDMLVTSNLTANRLNDMTFVDGLTLGDVRGKALVTWGWENDEALSLPYVFQRDNDIGGRKYSVLHSFYYGSLNKKSSQTYVKEVLPYYLQKYKELEANSESSSKGMRVLQGQLTDGMYVFGPRFREATHTKNMNAYLDNLKTNADDLPYVNIVIRDFVTPSKNCYTLQLNLCKNLVKADSVAAFEKMINDNIQ